MFLTRIPVPVRINHHSGMLQSAARYFTWVGLLVGGVGGVVLYGVAQLFSPSIAIAFSMLATILATGAFHEDGFADCCDAFGGGWTKEKILLIMKDSRLGTYGVTGLIGILGLKFLFLQEISGRVSLLQMALMLVAAHGSSRLMAIFIMQRYSYVQDTDTSKSKPIASRKLTVSELCIACAGVILPFLFLPALLALTILPMLGISAYAGRYFKKWIGGYTGDCLGATQQIAELFFYLSALLIMKYF